MVGSALKLHPMISVVDGKMIAGKKYRGNLSKVIMGYSKDLENDMRHAKKERVFITHSGCDREIVESVRKYLDGLDIFDEILETRAGGVVSSHCGPGTLGVLFIEQG
jgi:fatty acid-binding protein DegV